MADISPRRGSPSQFALFRFLIGTSFLLSFVTGKFGPQISVIIAGAFLSLGIALGWRRRLLSDVLVPLLVLVIYLTPEIRWSSFVQILGIVILLVAIPEGEGFSFSPSRGGKWGVPPAWMFFAELLFFGGGWFCAISLYREGYGLALIQDGYFCRLAILGMMVLDARWLHPRFSANPPVVFFDGVCGLCSEWVDWLFAEDANQIFHVSALQSGYAKANLDPKYVPGPDADPTSIVLKDEMGTHIKSTAVLRTASKLGGILRWARLFEIIPLAIRDSIYDYVAKNRYRWFGKKETCRLPTKEERARFLT